jgi:hypothetical protein
LVFDEEFSVEQGAINVANVLRLGGGIGHRLEFTTGERGGGGQEIEFAGVVATARRGPAIAARYLRLLNEGQFKTS